jgi:hypothetical protein
VNVCLYPGFPLPDLAKDKLRGNDDSMLSPIIPAHAGIQIIQSLNALVSFLCVTSRTSRIDRLSLSVSPNIVAETFKKCNPYLIYTLVRL